MKYVTKIKGIEFWSVGASSKALNWSNWLMYQVQVLAVTVIVKTKHCIEHLNTAVM